MKDVLETVTHYKEVEKMKSSSSILREVKWQYADMANGGNGGELGFGEEGSTCRSYNYPGYTDAFFQEVCTLMGWEW